MYTLYLVHYTYPLYDQQLGDFGGASQCYDGVVQLEPEHSKAWYNLGYLNADAEDQVCVVYISAFWFVFVYFYFFNYN
jgi:tetratricopeptide (TPR) repeat protein